jgi:hypothetical protein
MDIGPVKSTCTRSSLRVALIPSQTVGTCARTCLPRTQGSHVGGSRERSRGIPSTTEDRAMSRTVTIVMLLSWYARCLIPGVTSRALLYLFFLLPFPFASYKLSHEHSGLVSHYTASPPFPDVPQCSTTYLRLCHFPPIASTFPSLYRCSCSSLTDA